LVETRRPKAAAHSLLPMVRQLGAVQLDTISVLFEYWSHAACILPAESWPLFAFRRRHHVRRGCQWSDAPSASSLRTVLDRLRSDGPLTVSELGGARRSAGWWQWSEAKNALEWLLLVGQVTCARRVGWRRVYDLPERALPDEVTTPAKDWVDVDGIAGPDDHACQVELVRAAANTLGIGTAADIADVHRLNAGQIPVLAQDAGLVPVEVRGWVKPAWATPEVADRLVNDGQSRRSVRSRTTLLSPFDSLIWFRDRVERLFGVTHRLEAYTPATERDCRRWRMTALVGSTGARTKLPPLRPRRVSTRPCSRRLASASRSVTVETPSCAESSVSLGSCSPSESRPSAIDSVIRWMTASVRPPEVRGANTVVRADTRPSAIGPPARDAQVTRRPAA